MRARRLLAKKFNYSHVGITKADKASLTPSLQKHVDEDTEEIGAGVDRWEYAGRQTLSWGIQRHAGYSILPVTGAPTLSKDGAETGNASAPELAVMEPEMTVQLRRRFGPLVMSMPVRVIYVLDEPRRKGFAFGTLAGHPVSGEVAFLVEHKSDDSVHFTLRSFSGPGKGLWVFAYPVVLLLRGGLKKTYFEALTGEPGTKQ